MKIATRFLVSIHFGVLFLLLHQFERNGEFTASWMEYTKKIVIQIRSGSAGFGKIQNLE